MKLFNVFRILIAGALVTACGQAQTAKSFEVASIRPTAPDESRTQLSIGAGRFTAEGVTVKTLIEQAWSVAEFQIVAAPGWLGSERFDINAKAEGINETNIEQMIPMLRGLLTDRFHLRFHREPREMQAFALTVSKAGPKLTPAAPPVDGKPGQGLRRLGRGVLQAQNVTTSTLAEMLSRQLERTVSDKTGLNGTFDVDLKWTPDSGESPGAEGPGPSIYAALQEQLGLRLESVNTTVEMLVIDSVEKPSEN